MSGTVIVIPARFGSTRLPGKPLIRIAGRTLIERVWQIATSAKHADAVYVATDDTRIAEAVKGFGGKAVMTQADCANGSERTLAALSVLGITPEIVLNFQGDAPLIPPSIIDQIIEDMRANPQADICTPAICLRGDDLAQFLEEKRVTPATGTSVVMTRDGNALYFSKAVLPFDRGARDHVFRHIGLYAYRTPVLRELCALPESPLEKSEKLEQLRALENGFSIRVTTVNMEGRTLASVDAPEDVERVERIIKAEGELVS